MTFINPKKRKRGKPFTSQRAKELAKLRDPRNMVRGSPDYYRRLAKLPRKTAQKRAKLLETQARFQ
jgi:hypothetical protein